MTLAFSPGNEPAHKPKFVREVYDVRITAEGQRDNVHENFHTTHDDVAGTLARLGQMIGWTQNWDGRGAAKPSLSALIRATHWIADMRKEAMGSNRPWRNPHVTPDQDGEIVFEWSVGEKTLSVYVAHGSIEYLKVWGADMISQMDEGVIVTQNQRQNINRELWSWLMEQA